MANRITQLIDEALVQNTNANAEVSQLSVGALVQNANANARMSQSVIEVLTLVQNKAEVLQLAIEVLVPVVPGGGARSQAVIAG
jgi:hypothetical protein